MAEFNDNKGTATMSQFGAILKQKGWLLLAHKFDNLLLTIWTLVSVEPQTEHKKIKINKN